MDDSFFVILGLVFAIPLLLLPITTVMTFSLNKRVRLQEMELAALRKALAGLGAPLPPPVAEAQPRSPFAPPPVTPPGERGEAPEEPAAEPPRQPWERPAEPPVFAQEEPPAPAEEPARPAPKPRSTWKDIEESLTSRWLIWLGGATLALAGAFFIKLSVDKGWLVPSVRVALGLLAGIALMVGGEWVRRKELRRPAEAGEGEGAGHAGAGLTNAGRPDYVPPALTAAGLFTAFASVYGGFALFDLFAPLVAFTMLAGLAFLGIALSLLQGPFIAALGLLGGYATPMLVTSGDPMVWGLFAYLLALNGGGMFVVLWRGWRWLGWGTLLGGSLWVLVWFAFIWNYQEDALPVGLYLLLTTALFLMPALWAPAPAEPEETVPAETALGGVLPDWLRRKRNRLPADRQAVAAAILLGGLTAVMTWTDGHSLTSLAVLGLFSAFCLVVGRRVERIAGIAWVAALASILALWAWVLPYMPAEPAAVTPEGQPAVPVLPVLVPEAIGSFLRATGAFAVLFGLGGFVALWNSRRMALWASLSALVPVVLLAFAYAMVEPPQTSTAWPATALALAAALVAATTPLARHRHRPGASLGLAAFAAGAVGAISLGATMLLREAWLTVALALQVPVLGWLEHRMGLRSLRGVILLVALAVLARLAVNPFVLDYQAGGLGWILYGYGIPAIGFFLAARWLRQAPDGRGDDLVVALLEAGALIFSTMLVSLEIHDLTVGTAQQPPSTLKETALHTLAWLALAVLLTADRRWSVRPVARWGRRILVALAAMQALFLQVIDLNPVDTGEPVGDWPVANVLLLAYGLPALLGLLYLWLDPLPRRLRTVGAALPFLLIATNLALEIRHAFRGPVLSYGPMTDAEWYSYSAGFLAFAVILLIVALRFHLAGMRHVAILLVLGVVAKVFLSDMDDLEGLYRVASFLGLGLALIGIGYLYRRLQSGVRPPPELPAAGPQPPEQAV